MRLPDMRLRFSIRWLLVLIAAAATLCYVLFVRPTVLAHRFVDAVKGGDYETAKSLLLDEDKNVWVFRRSQAAISLDRLYAEVLPHEWSDIWRLRRRLLLRPSFHEDSDSRHIEWTEDLDLVSHIHGLQIVGTYDAWKSREP